MMVESLSNLLATSNYTKEDHFSMAEQSVEKLKYYRGKIIVMS